MSSKVVAVVAVVVAVSLMAEGRIFGKRHEEDGSHRRGCPYHSGRRGLFAAERYMWTRDVADAQVEERAFALEYHQFVVLNSSDASLASMGYQAAKVFYSFPENDEPLMAIATRGNGRGSPCFLTSTDLTYDEMVSELEDRNVSSISEIVDDDEPISLDGTGEALSREEARALYRAYPGLRRVCRRGKVIDTRVAPQAAAEPEETRVIKVLVFDTVVEITFSAADSEMSARPSGRRHGRRGQRQGRRGRGQGYEGHGRRGHGHGRRHGRRGSNQAGKDVTVELM